MRRWTVYLAADGRQIKTSLNVQSDRGTKIRGYFQTASQF